MCVCLSSAPPCSCTPGEASIPTLQWTQTPVHTSTHSSHLNNHLTLQRWTHVAHKLTHSNDSSVMFSREKHWADHLTSCGLMSNFILCFMVSVRTGQTWRDDTNVSVKSRLTSQSNYKIMSIKVSIINNYDLDLWHELSQSILKTSGYIAVCRMIL